MSPAAVNPEATSGLSEMDLYGHLVDQNLWDAAQRFGGGSGDTSGTSRKLGPGITKPPGEESGS
jgi:hypothetical protein